MVKYIDRHGQPRVVVTCPACTTMLHLLDMPQRALQCATVCSCCPCTMQVSLRHYRHRGAGELRVLAWRLAAFVFLLPMHQGNITSATEEFSNCENLAHGGAISPTCTMRAVQRACSPHTNHTLRHECARRHIAPHTVNRDAPPCSVATQACTVGTPGLPRHCQHAVAAGDWWLMANPAAGAPPLRCCMRDLQKESVRHAGTVQSRAPPVQVGSDTPPPPPMLVSSTTRAPLPAAGHQQACLLAASGPCGIVRACENASLVAI